MQAGGLPAFLLALKPGLGPLVLHGEWRLVLLTAAFGAAAAFYIAGPLPVIGPRWLSPIACLAAAPMLYGPFRRRFLFQILAFIAGGLASAAVAVAQGTPPAVAEETFVRLEALVERVEYRPERPARLTVRPTRLDRAGLAMPGRIRLIVRTALPDALVPGERVVLSALLAAPSGPSVPGGYDFGRDAYFAGIGAEGFAASAVERVTGAGPVGWRARLERLRLHMAEDLMDAIPGQAGAVAVALTVGYRNHISEETAQALRRAGLSHLLAISGLHMGLVTAAAFFVLEYLLAAMPAVALRVRPKKLAAVGAWSVAVAYLLLSGAGIATIRAFVMVSVALLAVLMDRRVLSLRSVALAALFVLILWPEAVLSIGFQMSFAATAVLVAFYEYVSRRGWLRVGERPDGVMGRIGRFILATGLTSLVAQMAVAPFALYHFQAVSLIGIAANILIVPIVSLLVMPLALLTCVLMPLGLTGWIAQPLGLTLGWVIALAHLFAEAPMALLRAGAPGDGFLMGMVIMLILGLVLRGRWLAVPVFGLIMVTLAALPSRQADILIDNSGRVIARYDKRQDNMMVVGGRRGAYRDDSWRQYWGLDPLDPSLPLERHCDIGLCRTALEPGLHVSHVFDIETLRRACGAGDLVITPRRWWRYCRGALFVATEEEIGTKGPLALYLPSLRSEKIKAVWGTPPVERPWRPQ